MDEQKSELRMLYELDKNSRASFASVGRVIHKSAQEVKRKYDALKEDGLLRYCFPIVDYGRLGYFFIVYLLKLHNMTKESEDEFYKYLIATNSIPQIMRGDGHFDLAFGIAGAGMVAAERIFQDINSRFSSFIMSYETIIPTGAYKFTRAYLAGKTEEPKHSIFTEEEVRPIKIKEEMLRVLEAVNADGRASLRDISYSTRISYDKVKNNLRKLEEGKIIKGYTFLLHHNRMGFPRFRVHFQLHNLSRPREQSLFDYCSSHPNIVHYLRLLGAWQLALDIEITGRDALRDLLREMKARFADIITRVEPTHLYQIDKYRDLPLELTLPAPIV